MNPKVLGILNVTPDSFSDGGQFTGVDAARSRALEMVQQGADALDVGGESTRPGSLAISVEEELQRVLPLLEAIQGEVDVPISIDTRRAEVAREAMVRGVRIVNDTSALQDDPALSSVIAEHQLTVILMHRNGIPETMQRDPRYLDVLEQIRAFLEERIEFAVAAGIPREQIVIDPGLGFGKSIADNYQITGNLDYFRSLGVPLLLGASRKSFTGIFDGSAPEERLPASLAFVARAQRSAVEWVRVHDVEETVTFLKALAAIEEPQLIEEGIS